jgi:hypothetical protein
MRLLTRRHWSRFAHELVHLCPEDTRSVMLSALLDLYPSASQQEVFGINTARHWEAMRAAIREAEISPVALDQAKGDGEQITALVRSAPSNPHKDVTFSPHWDSSHDRPFEEDITKSPYDALLAHQTGESILIRLEAFGDEFERLAKTAKQGVLAERFNVAVSDFAKGGPVTAADLEPLGKWLKGQGERFEALARTPEQEKLAASLREFISEINSAAVKEAFQTPMANELVEEIKEAMAEGSSGGVPFARLSQEGKQEFLSYVIDWTDFINRGLEVSIGDEKTYQGIGRIIDNAIAGKPCEQWLGGTEPAAKHIEASSNGQQRLKKLTTADLKEASQGLPKEKTQSPAAERRKDRGIER